MTFVRRGVRPVARRPHPAPIFPARPIQPVSLTRGQPLPSEIRAEMEQRFGFRFDQVRIYADERAERSASALNARAYTIGPRILFGPGQYAPTTARGKLLIAHELAHVVQQSRAPVYDTLGVGVSAASDSAERAADTAARRVLDGSDLPGWSAPGITESLLWTAPATPTLQRRDDDDADPFELLRSGVRAARGGIRRAGRFLRGQVRQGARELRRLSQPAEGRQQLIDMVDDPALAHKQWAATSFGGKQAVLQAMRRRYGEDWTDEFLAHQEGGTARAGMESFGRAPAVEELEALGYALASSYPMTLDSRFERWVHPDGRSAQMVREDVFGQPLEAPPSGAELIEPPEPAEDDRELDMPFEELQELVPSGPWPAEREVREIRVEDHDDGSRTITVTTTTARWPYRCTPDDTCSAGVMQPLGLEEEE